MSKPTMQDIADALSTSRITVWKALNNREGVSDELRAKIFSTAESMGYFNIASTVSLNRPQQKASKTISAVVSRPESSAFWMEIIHQVAKELAYMDVNLMYTYMPSFYNEGYVLPSILNDDSISGMIVLNVYSEKLLKMLGSLKIPKVFLDTMPSVKAESLNGDLMLIEGRCLIGEITGRLIDKGYTKLGFIGDTNYAQTNTDRYLGFMDAFKSRGLPVPIAYNMTEHIGLRTHYEEISDFLSELPDMPEGFVCASDYIANFVRRYFLENGIDPDKIILTGFDNNMEYENVAGAITTVDVKTQMVGNRLVNKILFAMENPGATQEVSYISSKIIYRGILK